MDFTGTRAVVSSPDFDYDYLSMGVEPYVTLRQTGDRVEGEYQVGFQTGACTDGWRKTLIRKPGWRTPQEIHGSEYGSEGLVYLTVRKVGKEKSWSRKPR